MSRAYCSTCGEYRTENAWGFIWWAGSVICQRCQCVVEFPSNGQEDEAEEIEDDGIEYE